MVFKGYQKEAEVFLNGKLDKTEFINFKDLIKKENQNTQKDFSKVDQKISNLNDEIYKLKVDIQDVRNKFDDFEGGLKSSIEYSDINSEPTIDFEKIDYDNINKIPLPHLSQRVIKPMYKQIQNLKKDIHNEIEGILKANESQSNMKLLELARDNDMIKNSISEAVDQIDNILKDNQKQKVKLDSNIILNKPF